LKQPERTLERIERALAVAAYVVVKHGPVYAPLLESLEREAERLRDAERNSPEARARRVLESYRIGGGRKAILLSHD
jgi:hypothetical protein